MDIVALPLCGFNKSSEAPLSLLITYLDCKELFTRPISACY